MNKNENNPNEEYIFSHESNSLENKVIEKS